MILLLAGTEDARRLAEVMLIEGLAATASLAGATQNPARLALPTRVGGFGGDEGFEAYLDAENITAVIDATHPFATRISARTARICAHRGLPYLQLLRPGFAENPGETWTWIDTEADAAGHIPSDACVFLATGRQSLPHFQNLQGRRVICRMIDPPDAPFPFEGGEFVIARPPFTFESERDLFQALGVTWLVAKDSGGSGRAKLDAARSLGIKVAMIRRPPPSGEFVTSIAAAVAWARQI